MARSVRACIVIWAALTSALFLIPAAAETGVPAGPESKIAPWLLDRLSGGEGDSLLVLFDRPETLRAILAGTRGAERPGRVVYDVLRERARTTQSAVRAWLDARGIPHRTLYIVNGLQVSGSLGLARALAARPEVARIVGDPAVRGIERVTEVNRTVCGLPWGVATVGASAVWSQDDVRGEGIVIASADTGVQWDHPALIAAYRGWDGESASHDYSWHDAIDDLPVPLDDHGHGTHTVGTMVGEDSGVGEWIGVAPGARWIGCRNMDLGVGRPSTYLECNQYFLAPWPHGGDPETDGDPAKAPDIVNNSWACPTSEGCDPSTLQDSFAALRAAGILAVAAAGNSGPLCSTVTDPPAIYEESFVVGATDSSNALASFSSRGPVTVDGSGRLRPDVAAPGVSVCSSVPVNGYASFSGTSMASPHTSGVAALLWSARPQLKNMIGISRCVLSRSASASVTSPVPPSECGGTTASMRPNDLFGWGLVSAPAAIHLGPDGDADGVADACDCAAADGGAYDLPEEVRALRFDADETTILWDSLATKAGPGTVYDLVRGTLADLIDLGSIATAGCRVGGTSVTSFADADAPSPGAGFYYLVQARNACGVGGWGSDSSGAARTHELCP